MCADSPTYDDGTGNLKGVHNVFEMGFSPDPEKQGFGKWWGRGRVSMHWRRHSWAACWAGAASETEE
jgi:hypothetical protein